MRAYPSYHTAHGVTCKRRRGCKLATKQRGNFIVPNLVLRQGIGPKSAFWAGLRHDPGGLVSRSGKVIVSRPARLSSDRHRSPVSGLNRIAKISWLGAIL